MFFNEIAVPVALVRQQRRRQCLAEWPLEQPLCRQQCPDKRMLAYKIEPIRWPVCERRDIFANKLFELHVDKCDQCLAMLRDMLVRFVVVVVLEKFPLLLVLLLVNSCSQRECIYVRSARIPTNH